MNDSPEYELATPQEVADYMRTTVEALSQDRYLGQGIPYVKHGRRVLYRWADVHAYIESNHVSPNADSGVSTTGPHKT